MWVNWGFCCRRAVGRGMEPLWFGKAEDGIEVGRSCSRAFIVWKRLKMGLK